MHAPTLILAGMIIKKAFDWKSFRFFSVLFTIVTALLFSGILSKLGKMVYDPPYISFTDPVWLIFHVIMWLISFVMLYMYWSEYCLGIIFSLLPELDYIIIGTANAFGQEVIFYKEPWIHNTINYFIDNVVPFSYLNKLPDFRSSPLSLIWEILFFGFLMLIFKIQLNRRRNIHF
jgi:hypothetical protein